jgi:putative transposase
MTTKPASYHRHRFPAEIISHAVWLYHVFSLSLRDVELILAERGVIVTHESIRYWCRKFGADFARRLRRRRPKPGDTWHLDEVFIRINGVLHYLWRAVDQHGSCSISSCRIAGMPPRQSAFSSVCCTG